MPTSRPFAPGQSLSLEAFGQLQNVLYEMAAQLEGEGLVLEEVDLNSSSELGVHEETTGTEKFIAFISKGFSVLLQGHCFSADNVSADNVSADNVSATTVEFNSARKLQGKNSVRCQMSITFEPEAIAQFLSQLLPALQSKPLLARQVVQAKSWLSPNDPLRQSEFTLRILAAMDRYSYAQAPVEEACLETCAIQQENLEQAVQSRTQNLQEAMLAAQAANKAKSQFLAAISHELRTPLTAIIGMSSTLLRWSFGELSDRQRSFLQTIHSSGQRLLELINDMLDLSQIEEGKMALQLREFSLSLLVQQTLREFRDAATAKEIELELDLQIDPRFDQFVADSQRIRQILSNLLSNALKFTEPGGRVTLRVFADQYYSVFRVKDTGIGIPEEQRSLLFQKFQQLDTSYRRVYQGAGLGLALTKQLVELHGGRISVESTVGVGSVFTVQIPNRLSTVTQVEPTPEPVSDHLLGRVVLIESHEETANIICDLLTAANYHVVWMLEESTAINRIEVIQPMVVILDLQPNSLSMYNLVSQLRQNPATKQVKVVVLQGEEVPPPVQGVELEVDSVLTKPVQPAQVLPCIFKLTLDTDSTQSHSEFS